MAMCIPGVLMALLLAMARVESWLDSRLDLSSATTRGSQYERPMIPAPRAFAAFQEIELTPLSIPPVTATSSPGETDT